MKWLSFALATYVGLVTAHGDHAIPHVVGGRQILAELRARGVLGGHGHHARHAEAAPATSETRQRLDTRQKENPQCGPGVGKCPDGQCCSPAGFCGTGKWYCDGPDCQINYSNGCDADKKPSGTDTTKIARPLVGGVPYGGLGIYNCVNPGEIALTFDDGPYKYTGDLLDIFKASLSRYEMVATFFVTGNNIGKGMINDRSLPWAGYIQRMIAEGHQVASHTWSHQNASQLTDTQYRQQINYNEIAIADIIGYFPTYMRPPYSICESNCQRLLVELGYHVIYFDLDTEGYLHDKPDLAYIGKGIWDKAVGPANPADTSFLQIEHDLQQTTVYNLTEYFLKSIKAKGFRTVPVGVCLGDDPANWYRKVSKDVPTSWPPAGVTLATPTGATATSSSSASATSSSGKKISTDAQCGSTKPNNLTCQGSAYGNCCSRNGWCGSTADYCGDGCQSDFGTCFNAVSSSITSVNAPSSTSSSSSTASSSVASSSATSDSSTNVSSTSASSIELSTSTSIIIPLSTSSIDSATSASSTSASVSSSNAADSTTSTSSSAPSSAITASTDLSSGSITSSSVGTLTSTSSLAATISSTSPPSSIFPSSSSSSSSTTLTPAVNSASASTSTAVSSTFSSSSSSTSSSTSTNIPTTTSNSTAITSSTLLSSSPTTSSGAASTSAYTGTSVATTSSTSLSSSSSTRSTTSISSSSSATSTSSSHTSSSSTGSSSTTSSIRSSSTTLPNNAAIAATNSPSSSRTTSSTSSILTTTTQANTVTTSSSAAASSSSSSLSSSTSSLRSTTSSAASAARSSSSTSSSSSRSSSSTSARTTSTISAKATSTSKTTATPVPTAIKVTTNGDCGKSKGMTCEGSGRSPCCSSKGKCSWECFSGCQKGYGLCLW
ncbi:hypothetical protein PspLS_02222 [Pyricularia sp. CBS 133598]|nr:hypothetical protein PspLS_02222 [Pyricularia sp. CBS 133598]